jgi:hypothetical protein
MKEKAHPSSIIASPSTHQSADRLTRQSTQPESVCAHSAGDETPPRGRDVCPSSTFGVFERSDAGLLSMKDDNDG